MLLKITVTNDTMLSPVSCKEDSTIELKGSSAKTFSDIFNYTGNMLMGWTGLFVSGFRK